MQSSAQGVTWDLTDLYRSPTDPAIDADLARAEKRAAAWEKKYRGRLTGRPPIKAGELAAMVTELEAICEQRDKPVIYAHLLFAGDTGNAQYRALMQSTQERSVPVAKHLVFFELEWCAVDDATAKRLLAAPELARYRHYLEAARRYQPHQLTEAEEKIITELSVTGSSAFIRLFDQLLGAARFEITLDGRKQDLSEQEVLTLLYRPDRETRRAAAAALTAGLARHRDTLGLIMNTLVQEHATMDRLRRFAEPMAARNLSNEISARTVAALLRTVDQHAPLVARYYHLKRRLLGLAKLYDYDRYAPIAADQPACDWQRCHDLVLAAYRDFSPKMAEIAEQFYRHRWLDAELRPGKRGGAFSASTVPSVHPYILVNYTDKLRDAMTVAHELGHGVHQYLSRERGYLQSSTPLTLAETASVFGEMLTFQRMMAEEKDPKVRLGLLCSKIEDIIATAFRQVCMTRFEQMVHEHRRKEGELPAEKLDEFWLKANRQMFGDSVELTADYGLWWSYIPHFVHTPFYCYAYAFGELLVLALFRQYQHQGRSFVPKYLELLAAGGSEKPEILVRRLGLDIDSAGFWKQGMVILDEMIGQAEALADEIGATGRAKRPSPAPSGRESLARSGKGPGCRPPARQR